MTTLPKLTDELIEQLDKLYQLSTPKPGDQIDKIMFNAGQRSVVDFLLHVQAQEKNQ